MPQKARIMLSSTDFQKLEDVCSQIKKIADLPSKEVVLAQLMGMINAPARGIAVGMNQIMASLARGIKAVAEARNQQ